MNKIKRWGLVFAFTPFLQYVAAREAYTERAVAVVNPTKGSKVRGRLEFVHKMGVNPEVLQISGEISGLEPNSVHGFHIHETGNCSGPNAESAGGHFNPKNMPHGGPFSSKHHAGDLGNILAGPNGVAVIDMSTEDLKLEGKDGVLNRAVIIHEKIDDLNGQPSGNAGSRLACGVIEKTN